MLRLIFLIFITQHTPCISQTWYTMNPQPQQRMNQQQQWIQPQVNSWVQQQPQQRTSFQQPIQSTWIQNQPESNIQTNWVQIQPQQHINEWDSEFDTPMQSSSLNIPSSPCPDILNYEHLGNQIVGVAYVVPSLNPNSRNQTIRVIITLTVNAVIPTNYAGKLELYDDKNLVVQRIQQGSSEPIKYRIHFPVQSPIPVYNNFQVNEKSFCKGQQAGGPGHTTLTLSHRLIAYINWPIQLSPSRSTHNPIPIRPNLNPVTSRPTLAPDPPTRPPTTRVTTSVTTRVTSRPTRVTARPAITRVTTIPPRISNRPIEPLEPSREPTIESDEECGTVVRGVSLVIEGKETNKNQWPWLAAMFTKTETGLEFQCGASLVSKSHVVTAAHCCLSGSSKIKNAESILIFLGKHNIRDWTEPNTQPRDVLNIIIHPGYLPGGDKTDHDLAVLVLAAPATFSLSVRPICLWQQYTTSHALLKKEGTVVGWGRDDKGNRISEQPKMITMPVVTQEECLRSHRYFYYFTTNYTYCAGGRDGSGPCKGDSGGGMYIPERTSDGRTRWMLRGIVSLALPDEAKLCDLSNYVVFTDMSKFTNWIYDVMEKHKT